MPKDDTRNRSQSRVRPEDDDFRVRVVVMDDLIRIQRDDESRRRDGRWTSEEALRRQVRGTGTMFLSPLFRNAGRRDIPESYRCWLWFTPHDKPRSRAVVLLDVDEELYAQLPEAASVDQLKLIISVMLNGAAEGVRLEPIL